MEVIVLDTNILIDHKNAIRKNKSETFLYQLAGKYSLAITVISVFELLRGNNKDEQEFWEVLFNKITVLPFDYESSQVAGRIDKELISKGKRIKTTDLFIASIALRHGYKVATRDNKDFSKIKGLQLIATP